MISVTICEIVQARNTVLKKYIRSSSYAQFQFTVSFLLKFILFENCMLPSVENLWKIYIREAC